MPSVTTHKEWIENRKTLTILVEKILTRLKAGHSWRLGRKGTWPPVVELSALAALFERADRDMGSPHWPTANQ